MSRTHLWISLALGLLAAPALAAPAAWLRPQVDYTADSVMQADRGTLVGRVWASGAKERRELTVDGRLHVVILRKDRGVSWVLMPEQGMYVETELGENASGADRFEGGSLERESLGREKVNGADAIKYRVHGKTADGEAFEGTMWMTAQEIPVRVITGKGAQQVRMELRNISVGPLDAGRFEVPRGYTRFELPAPAKADLRSLRERYSR